MSEQDKKTYSNINHIKPDSEKSDFAMQEESVLSFWENNSIFKKSLSKNSPLGEYVFYDGPPFATGMPHYGHILAGIIKDAIPRYQTMKGHYVSRRWGWDCHGLPIEKLIQEENNLKTKKDIEDFGIKNFSKAAKASVFRYDKEWKKIVPRTGRWVDMENQYTTMDPEFMESVWWAFSELYKKGLIYEGFKSMHISPPLETPLSNFEVNQNYKDITDISVYVKFKLTEEIEKEKDTETFIVAWTTTPWTLFGNVALAVGNDIDYVKLKILQNDQGKSESVPNENIILAKKCLDTVLKDKKYEIITEIKGKDLIGKRYEPVFDYYSSQNNLENHGNGWQIYSADFVTTEDGTGIVHIAPAFGEDDLKLGQKNKLPFIQHVNIDGSIKKDIPELAGHQAKPKSTPENPNSHQETDIKVLKMLALKNRLFAKEKFTHSYPHCWRTDAPLLNYAMSSWFIRVTNYNHKMVALNKKIKWVPKNVGEKRFGNWLENVKDWGVSRSRYWGTTMPVWKSDDGTEIDVLSSVCDIRSRTKSKNRFFIMRHGESDHNISKIWSSDNSVKSNLTKNGIEQVKQTSSKIISQLKNQKIDLIYTSPLDRTKQTAKIVAEEIGLSPDKIIVDDRLKETQSGKFNGTSGVKYREYYSNKDAFADRPDGGENFLDIKKRVGEFIYEIDKKYHVSNKSDDENNLTEKNPGKNILIISHDWPIWLLFCAAEGLDKIKSLKLNSFGETFIKTGEVRELDFAPIPHDDDFVLDLHRPYIDEIVYHKNGKKMIRIPDVFDTWFDSGSMPYAVPHYPFSDEIKPFKSLFEKIFGSFSNSFKKQHGFPADFIAEGLDQTRGWFYTLLALNTALFNQSPYKNVIVNGLVLAEDGQKMSKRLKNYPEPNLIFDKYGADAMRYYMLSSQIVESEPLAFSEKEVDEIYKKIIARLLNVVSFYEMYINDIYTEKNTGEKNEELNKSIEKKPKNKISSSDNILDKWIISRLNEVIIIATKSMENYKLNDACRPFFDFVDDLSTWYIRRSRDRFKGDDESDKEHAIQTTKFVLENFSKIIAPFMPFVAEIVYQRTTGFNFMLQDKSVHLTDWPLLNYANKNSDSKNTDFFVDKSIINEMKKVREIVSLALLERDKAGIRVRQPLETLKIIVPTSELDDYSLELIRDEVNVHQVIYDDTLDGAAVWLDTRISEELKEEGIMRELNRFIQSLRKDAKLHPNDKVIVAIETDEVGQYLVKKFSNEIKKSVKATDIKFSNINTNIENNHILKTEKTIFKISIS